MIRFQGRLSPESRSFNRRNFASGTIASVSEETTRARGIDDLVPADNVYI